MPVSVLIIVTGAPCTGKTTLAARFAADLGWPLLHKDGIKERLFDTLGWSDRAWSKQLGLATYAVLFYAVESVLRGAGSLVVESNFKPAWHADRFRDLQRAYGFVPVQVCCHADRNVLLARFKTRLESGERHPGHVDHDYLPEFEASLLNDDSAPMDLDGPVLEVDTSDFAALDYAALLARLRAALESRKNH
ncbi:MAG: ATP-binding protein [Anaerolineae bacterium]|nr:ATP-binding protein [Anaerolineae bacterium]